MGVLAVEDLGRIGYAEALSIQRAAQAALISARGSGHAAPMRLYLLEHDPPVITVTRRVGAAAHVLASPDALARAGVELHETDRGGDVTYHGPGQVVAYAILDLDRLGLRVHSYMRMLEEIVIATCGSFGLACRAEQGATGVWTDAGGGPARKVCAMGVRLSRWTSMHGLALNVDPDLSHFGLIVPCGLAGRPVTSLARELGARAPDLARVKAELAKQFEEACALRLRGVSPSRPGPTAPSPSSPPR